MINTLIAFVDFYYIQTKFLTYFHYEAIAGKINVCLYLIYNRLFLQQSNKDNNIILI